MSRVVPALESVAIDSFGADEVAPGIEGPELAVVDAGGAELRAVDFQGFGFGHDLRAEPRTEWRCGSGIRSGKLSLGLCEEVHAATSSLRNLNWSRVHSAAAMSSLEPR